MSEPFAVKIASKQYSSANPLFQDPTVSENSDGTITVSWEELGEPGTGFHKTRFATYSADGTLLSTREMDGSDGWANLNDGDGDLLSQTITLEGGGFARAYLKHVGNYPLPNSSEFWLEFTPRVLTVAFDDNLTEGSDANLVISVTRPFDSDVTLSIELIPGSLSESELENLPTSVVLAAGATSITVPFHIKQNPAAIVDPETFTINILTCPRVFGPTIS